jgi:hypothetical protein
MQELLDDILLDEEPLNIKRNLILTKAILVQLGFALLAIILAIYDITTIMGTGPIGSVIGIAVFSFAYKLGFSKRMKIGLSAPIFSAICFSIIYFFDLSKDEAYLPIVALMVSYAMVLSFFVIIEIKRPRKRSAYWE